MTTPAPEETPGQVQDALTLPPTRAAYLKPLNILSAIILLTALCSLLPISNPNLAALLSQSSLETLHKRSPRALFLTAHPDDEAMFFSPTIVALLRQKWEVRGLCLSTGNESGLGEVRRKELYSSWSALGVPQDRVSVVDRPELQDGMDNPWPIYVIQEEVRRYTDLCPVDLIITFDPLGISSHPNHIALSELQPPSPSTRIVVLHSPALIPKYTGSLLPLLHKIANRAQERLHLNMRKYLKGRKDSLVIVSDVGDWWRGVSAMRRHGSQMRWFRWVYLGCSGLMWVNEVELAPSKFT